MNNGTNTMTIIIRNEKAVKVRGHQGEGGLNIDRRVKGILWKDGIVHEIRCSPKMLHAKGPGW
jgi:hypothetical protein